MAKLNIKLNSPVDTPEEDKIYVIEYPEVSRVKVRLVDLIKEKSEKVEEMVKIQDRIDHLDEVKKEIEKL